MRADLNGLTFNEAPRRAPAAELENVPRLARLGAVRREGETVRLGALGLPAELAERLNAAAQALGVPVAEVVRRAIHLVPR